MNLHSLTLFTASPVCGVRRLPRMSGTDTPKAQGRASADNTNQWEGTVTRMDQSQQPLQGGLRVYNLDLPRPWHCSWYITYSLLQQWPPRFWWVFLLLRNTFLFIFKTELNFLNAIIRDLFRYFSSFN